MVCGRDKLTAKSYKSAFSHLLETGESSDIELMSNLNFKASFMLYSETVNIRENNLVHAMMRQDMQVTDPDLLALFTFDGLPEVGNETEERMFKTLPPHCYANKQVEHFVRQEVLTGEHLVQICDYEEKDRYGDYNLYVHHCHNIEMEDITYYLYVNPTRVDESSYDADMSDSNTTDDMSVEDYFLDSP